MQREPKLEKIQCQASISYFDQKDFESHFYEMKCHAISIQPALFEELQEIQSQPKNAVFFILFVLLYVEGVEGNLIFVMYFSTVDEI